MSNDQFYTVNEVAEILKKHPRTIRRWIQSGKLPAQPLPGRGRTGIEYRIRRADFAAFLNAHPAGDEREVTSEQ